MEDHTPASFFSRGPKGPPRNRSDRPHGLAWSGVAVPGTGLCAVWAASLAGERRRPTAFGGARGSRRGAWGRLNSADAAMGNAAPFLSLGGMSPAPAPRCLLWCAAHRKCLGCGVCVAFLDLPELQAAGRDTRKREHCLSEVWLRACGRRKCERGIVCFSKEVHRKKGATCDFLKGIVPVS